MDDVMIRQMCAFERDAAFPDDLAIPIRMLVLDVDGVLTDGGLYYNEDGLAMKRFDVQDGLGIKLAQRAGIEVVIISGMASAALLKRAADLGVGECHDGCFHKLARLEQIIGSRGLSWENVAYVGDDVIDLPAMCAVGLPLAVHNAQPEVRVMARYVAPRGGGAGGVRWLIRHILLAQGRMGDLLADFAQEFVRQNEK